MATMTHLPFDDTNQASHKKLRKNHPPANISPCYHIKARLIERYTRAGRSSGGPTNVFDYCVFIVLGDEVGTAAALERTASSWYC